uniref:SCAN box domain-containing protein n=1 Tax=Leptobrachium leishanense TaxID=445787 RepID=A0A8C5MGF0_9ANUR
MLAAQITEQQNIIQILQKEVQVLTERSQIQQRAPLQSSHENSGIRASNFLQRMAESDDVEAYLLTFERNAEREHWPPGQWAGLLEPFLSGEPQKAYFDLEPSQANDYAKLKAEILTRLGVTAAIRAQRFHAWIFHQEKPPRSQMYDLIHLARKWLQPEVNTAARIIEQLVMDCFVRSLSSPLRKWVIQGNPRTADELTTLVERYLVAVDLSEMTTAVLSGYRMEKLKRATKPKRLFHKCAAHMKADEPQYHCTEKGSAYGTGWRDFKAQGNVQIYRTLHIHITSSMLRTYSEKPS